MELPVSQGINAYLIDGPNILVAKKMKPLSPMLAVAAQGSKPADGGHLIVEPAEYESVMADPIAAKYVRPFRMGKELVHGHDRWCLWLEDLNPSDVKKSTILRERISAVRTFREKAAKGGDAYKRKDIPHLMKISPYRPKAPYVAIPAVVSETRFFYTVDHYAPQVIAGNKVFTSLDPDGLSFALISSSMFITWQKAVGGRLESRLNFANTLTWNTFPVPELDEKTRERIIKAGQKVLDARALHPERSLAEHYNPLAMAPELLKAHDALDREVDKAMGAARKLTSERQRQELLFANYAKLTND